MNSPQRITGSGRFGPVTMAVMAAHVELFLVSSGFRHFFGAGDVGKRVMIDEIHITRPSDYV